jgi:hypothetical protein
VTEPGDLVVDPAGGNFGVMHAARQLGRNFIGCDIAYLPSADVDQIALAEQIPVRQQNGDWQVVAWHAARPW